MPKQKITQEIIDFCIENSGMYTLDELRIKIFQQFKVEVSPTSLRQLSSKNGFTFKSIDKTQAGIRFGIRKYNREGLNIKNGKADII